MYSTQNIADRIKLQAKMKKIIIKTMLSDCNMGINAISEFAKGKQLSCISLAKIADYLECSVDYLLGRTDNPNITYDNIHSSNIVNGNNGDNSPLTVAETEHYDEMTTELVKAFKNMSFTDKMEIMNQVLDKIKK